LSGVIRRRSLSAACSVLPQCRDAMQLHEIDRAQRAVLGAGVELRRLAVADGIDVWLMEYRRTRGLRRRALADRYEIGVQVQGSRFERTARGAALLEPGTTHVLGAGEAYDVAYEAGDESGRVAWFSVDADRVCDNKEAAREIVVGDAKEVSSELRELGELLFARDPRDAREPVDETLARDVRSATLRCLDRRGALSRTTPVATARREIERHFESDLYLHQIADTVGLRPVTLLRQFSRRYGTTPIQYRIKRRLNCADRLLWTRPDLSVAEVAVQAGFKNLSQFYRQFVAYLGATPARRREMFGSGSS
jgi:AraC-like DNA-binding protein